MKFLKNFGLGLLWFLLLPIIAVGIVGVAVFGFFNFFYQGIHALINFFKGEKKMFLPYEEDIKAEEALQRAIDEKNRAAKEEKEEPAPQPQTIYVQQTYYTGAGPTPIPPGYPQQQIPQGYQQQIPPQQNPYGNPYYQGQPYPQGQQIPPQPMPQVPPTSYQQIPPQEVAAEETAPQLTQFNQEPLNREESQEEEAYFDIEAEEETSLASDENEESNILDEEEEK